MSAMETVITVVILVILVGVIPWYIGRWGERSGHHNIAAWAVFFFFGGIVGLVMWYIGSRRERRVRTGVPA